MSSWIPRVPTYFRMMLYLSLQVLISEVSCHSKLSDEMPKIGNFNNATTSPKLQNNKVWWLCGQSVLTSWRTHKQTDWHCELDIILINSAVSPRLFARVSGQVQSSFAYSNKEQILFRLSFRADLLSVLYWLTFDLWGSTLPNTSPFPFIGCLSVS